LIPYAGHFDNVGRRVLIAWSATGEATRAVSDAMPFLTSAEFVTVLTIDAREGPRAHGELPRAEIALHLARHGVNAQIELTVSPVCRSGRRCCRVPPISAPISS
jgi:hypothetical protein